MITHIRCSDMDKQLAVDTQPVFTFRLTAGEALKMKAVVYKEENIDIPLWESNWLDTEYYRILCDAKLKPRTSYLYQIIVKYSDNSIEKSKLNRFETGLFGKAKWIGAEAPIIARKFKSNSVKKARLYVSACGIAEIYLNGKRTDYRVYSPVCSDYHKRDNMRLKYPLNDVFSYSHYYICDDVTSFIVPGENVLAVWLGNGWYNQTVRKNEGNMEYGKPRVKLSLYMEFEDGTTSELHSDELFFSYESPIKENQFFVGEVYDGRVDLLPLLLLQKIGSPVTVYPEFESVLRPQHCPPDRVIRAITPKLLYCQNNYSVYDVKTFPAEYV